MKQEISELDQSISEQLLREAGLEPERFAFALDASSEIPISEQETVPGSPVLALPVPPGSTSQPQGITIELTDSDVETELEDAETGSQRTQHYEAEGQVPVESIVPRIGLCVLWFNTTNWDLVCMFPPC